MSAPWMALHGAESLMKKLAAKKLLYESRLEAATTAAALIVENAAKNNAPYVTGTLKRSIDHQTKEKSVEKVVVVVGTNVEYAAIQEFGGTITAKNAPNLVFQTADGEWHSVPSVEIPAQPYLRPALDENREKVKDKIREVLVGF